MYIDRNTFLNAKKIKPHSIEDCPQTVQTPIKESSEISLNEYQELKDYWLKEIEDSTHWYMKGWIRTGGWI